MDSVPPDLSLLSNPHFHIFIATVLATDRVEGTNAEPPAGRLKLTEVLRGRDLQPGVYGFQMSAPVTGRDYKEGTFELDSDWHRRPLMGPARDDELIAFAYISKEQLEQGGSIAMQGPLIRYSRTNRDAVIARMAPPERSQWIQVPIALLVVLLPFASMIFHMRSRRETASSRRRTRAASVALALPGLALILYGYYETGISVYSSIRVDLVIIWPALALSAILLVRYAALRLLGSKSESG